MALLEVIEEQQVFGFSGKINILDQTNGQILGFVSLAEGDLLSCQFHAQRGKFALFNLFVKDRMRGNFKTVVEPEIVDGIERNLFDALSSYKTEFEAEYARYKNSLDKRPPNQLRLVIRPEFMSAETEVTQEEFSLLETIADYQLISDIYSRVNLYEHQTTEALVGLRKKGALTVLSK